VIFGALNPPKNQILSHVGYTYYNSVDKQKNEKKMSERKKRTLIYKGLGFPIKLIDVPTKKMFGDWVLDIDMTELQLIVLKALANKPIRLTKDELKFIRHFLGMTSTQFGKVFWVTHSAVIQWENGKRNLSPAIELCIRLYALDHLKVKDKEFKSLYRKITIEQLSLSSVKSIPPIEIDASQDLKIAL
jgi:DNA-binding transcriptional regulator YiaG